MLDVLLSQGIVAFGEKCAFGPPWDFVVVPALGPRGVCTWRQAGLVHSTTYQCHAGYSVQASSTAFPVHLDWHLGYALLKIWKLTFMFAIHPLHLHPL